MTCNSKAHATSWTGIPLIQVPINSFPDHPRGKGEQTPPIIRSRTFGVSLLIYCCGLRVLSWCPRISLPPFLSFLFPFLFIELLPHARNVKWDPSHKSVGEVGLPCTFFPWPREGRPATGEPPFSGARGGTFVTWCSWLWREGASVGTSGRGF